MSAGRREWMGGGFAVATLGWGAALWASGAATGLGAAVALSAFLGSCTTVLGAVGFAVVRAAVAPAPALELDPEETVLGTLTGGHWAGAESRGGRIYVTDRALRFVPRRLSFDRSPLRLPWAEIEEVTVAAVSFTGPIVGVQVRHRTGVDAFQVPHPEVVVRKLSALREAPPERRAEIAATLNLGPPPR